MAKTIKKEEKFVFNGPEASSVQLAGNFTGWEKSPIHLKKDQNGLWQARVFLEAGTHQYRFLVDGQWQDDPDCSQRVPNPFGASNCVRIVG